MHILLLQGPMSPFFSLLADDLETSGIMVSKINFNGGDEFYFHDSRAQAFRGSPESWKKYLSDYVLKYKVTMLMGYGDCRYYHRIAKEIAKDLNLGIYFFEEGYFRPHWVTLERGGVNAHSEIAKIRRLPSLTSPELTPVSRIPDHFLQRIVLCSLYYLAATLRRADYPSYQHHRVLSLGKEAFWWARAGVRKYLYKLPDLWKWSQLNRKFPKKYYLAPLQIRDDAQILYHSDYSSLDSYLEDIISSFSRKAASDTCLVIKHHPMDRGHTHYGKTIQALAREHRVEDRVYYVHDIANPMLLRNSLGLVTINSTMGISGLIHGKKVITLGRALYHQSGLTFTGSLDEFWQNEFTPDAQAFQVLRQTLMEESQVFGSFYYPRVKFTLPERFYRDLKNPRQKLKTRLLQPRKLKCRNLF